MTDILTQSKKVVFHNSCKIQPEAWEMHGVSAKLCDNPVGMFGTGLCYAIAVILRNGHKITIHSNEKRYEFGLIAMDFRGKEFQRVTCNGTPLAFTTHYGATWPLWAAYRELVSNTMDEGGIHFMGEPMDEGTSIVVEGDDFAEVMAHHEDYFLGERERIASCSSLDVFEGQGVVYYRGVKIGELKGASFSYQIRDSIDLTEDRTFKHEYQLASKIGYAYSCFIKDKKLLKRVAMMREGWEATQPDYDWTWSSEMKEVVSDLWATAPASLNPRLQRLVSSKAKEACFKMMEPNEDQQIMIDSACEFLEKAGYKVNAPVRVVESADANTIAYAYDKTINLTEKAFEKGLYYLVTVIFEESAHCNGQSDFSRSFQTYLIEELITNARKRLKIAL